MLDEPSLIKRKIGRAVTDSDDSDDPVRYDPETKPGVSNLLDIIAVVEGSDPAEVATRFTSYGALKGACTDAVVGVRHVGVEVVGERAAVVGRRGEIDAELAADRHHLVVDRAELGRDARGTCSEKRQGRKESREPHARPLQQETRHTRTRCFHTTLAQSWGVRWPHLSGTRVSGVAR